MARRVEIEDEKEVFHKAIFRVREARLRYERFDGSMTEELLRLNLDRGDSVAAVLYNPDDETVILVEQFRYPTYANGQGWILELPAGMVEQDENGAQQVTVRRELLEEVGYEPAHLEHILTFYVSPGGTSERILLYYGSIIASDQTNPGGGHAGEGEDIRVVPVSLSEALRMVEDNEIMDAKSIIGLQWLKLNRTKLRRQHTGRARNPRNRSEKSTVMAPSRAARGKR